MKFTIKRKEILKALQRVQGIVEKKAAQPILAYIYINVLDNKINMVATDLKIVLEGMYEANVEEQGAICVSAKMLFDIVREIDSGDVVIYSNNSSLVIIEAGHSVFKLIGVVPEEFPHIMSEESSFGFIIDSATLLSMINKTAFAVGSDETSGYTLSGIEIQVKADAGQLDMQFVGTDSHRLALIKRKLECDEKESVTGERKIIIPKKSILEVKKLLLEDDEKLFIGFSQRSVSFRKKDITIISRLLDGIYPKYDEVIPQAPDKTITFNKSEISMAIRRVSILTSGVTFCVEMAVESRRVILRSENPLVGDAMESVPAEYDGPGMMIGFNYRDILDVLPEIESDKIVLEIESYDKPILVKDIDDENFKYLLVPVTLDDKKD